MDFKQYVFKFLLLIMLIVTRFEHSFIPFDFLVAISGIKRNKHLKIIEIELPS